MDTAAISIYVNSTLVKTMTDRGGPVHHFKAGAYTQPPSSNLVEVYWTSIMVFD